MEAPIMYYSTIINVDEETLEKIKKYCEEENMRITIRHGRPGFPPLYVIVWGTKKQLRDFSQYF